MIVHRLVRVNHGIRVGAFAYCFLVLGLHGWERDFGAAFWLLMVLQFLVYPQLAYLRARASHDQKSAERSNLFVDAALLGAWTGGLGLPLWITYAALFSTTLNATVVRGVQNGLFSLACFGVGAALSIAMLGFQYSPATSSVVTTLCFAGSLAYSCAIGYVVYRQNLRFLRSRRELDQSEERHRLITENAGDLIALVDNDGRWLYASPSYDSILEEADLEVGVDAFRRVHPDDADRARLAVLRAAATGKARELALRLVDRDGRVRQYKTRVRPVMAGGGKGKEQGNRQADAPSTKIVLVSQDVTDLRESEERLLLAAHALEGMTEAIVITSADGTVVTVNRAFCEITGHAREDVLGTSEKEMRNALQPEEFYDEIYAAVHRDGYWSGSTWSRRKNGSVYREWRSVRAVRDAAGAVTHYVTVISEVGGAVQSRADDAAKA